MLIHIAFNQLSNGQLEYWMDIQRQKIIDLVVESSEMEKEVVDCRDEFPKAAEAPCRWRHEMWQEQGVVGPQRDQRDCQCQLPSEHPQAHQGWSCHQEARCCPLQVPCAQERRGTQEGQAHWFW